MINSDEFSILNSTNSTNSYFNIVSNDQFNLNSTLKQQQHQEMPLDLTSALALNSLLSFSNTNNTNTNSKQN